jgi:hypothetical protein
MVGRTVIQSRASDLVPFCPPWPVATCAPKGVTEGEGGTLMPNYGTSYPDALRSGLGDTLMSTYGASYPGAFRSGPFMK